jgi:hypothetical protein
MRHQPAQEQPRRRHRHDKPAVPCENAIRIAAINEWLRPGFLDRP